MSLYKIKNDESYDMLDLCLINNNNNKYFGYKDSYYYYDIDV